MKKFKILDCTLRDGGYYTNWDFPSDLIKNYFKSIDELPINYIEIGYRNLISDSYRGEYYYTPVNTLKYIKTLTKKSIVIILNERDIDIDHIPALINPCKGLVEMFRLAVDPSRVEIAKEKSLLIKKLGYKSAINLMYLSNWINDNELILKFKNIDKFCDYLYLVDSYGAIYPNQIPKLIREIKSHTSVDLGFHGHNNLELAFSNSLEAINSGVKIIDSTIMGMGRGSGNLKTEILIGHLSKEIKVNFNLLYKVICDFQLLKKKYNWETNLPYIIAGINSIPQKKIMEWIGKKFYSFNTIIRSLSSSKRKEKNSKFKTFSFPEGINNVLLIGGGKSVLENLTGIKKFISKNRNLLLIHSSSRFLNEFIKFKNENLVCFVGNEDERFESRANKKQFSNLRIIIPPYPRELGTFIPENYKDQTFELDKNILFKEIENTHCSVSLEIAFRSNMENFYFIGFDGYLRDNVSEKEREIFYDNEDLFRILKNKKVNLISLTPTLYKNLKSSSIYSLID